MTLPPNKKPKTASNPSPSRERVSSPGNVSSSSSSSSSATKITPSLADADNSEGELSAAEEIEQRLRAIARKAEPDAKKRMNSRNIARQGTWPCSGEERFADPGYFVRHKDHKYKMLDHEHGQAGGYCEETCHAFICLRLAGYSVRQTIAALKTGLIKGKLPEWNRQKLTLSKMATSGRLAQAGSQALIGISKSLFELIAVSDTVTFGVPADAKRMAVFPVNAQQPTHDLLLFEHILGKFPKSPSEFGKGKSDYDVALDEGGCAVEIRPGLKPPRPLPTFQHALFSFMEPCKPRMEAHPGNSQRMLTRIPTSFATLSFFSDSRGHMCVVDFSDPEHIGIFDPNHGWLEPDQGFCTLAFEKALTILWEAYAGIESSKKFDQDAKMGAACIDVGGKDVWAYSAQIHLQAAPRSVSPLMSASLSTSTGFSAAGMLQRPPSPMSPGTLLDPASPRSPGSASPPPIGLLIRKPSGK